MDHDDLTAGVRVRMGELAADDDLPSRVIIDRFQALMLDESRRQWEVRRAELESALVAGMALQDYDMLDRLTIIERPGWPPAVASLVSDLV